MAMGVAGWAESCWPIWRARRRAPSPPSSSDGGGDRLSQRLDQGGVGSRARQSGPSTRPAPPAAAGIAASTDAWADCAACGVDRVAPVSAKVDPLLVRSSPSEARLSAVAERHLETADERTVQQVDAANGSGLDGGVPMPAAPAWKLWSSA